jgi:hypothetical protein
MAQFHTLTLIHDGVRRPCRKEEHRFPAEVNCSAFNQNSPASDMLVGRVDCNHFWNK